MDGIIYHPDHYNHEGRQECWDEMERLFGIDAVVIFDLLNCYKYMYRAGTKPGQSENDDLAKADNYFNHAREIFFSHLYLDRITKDVMYIVDKLRDNYK